MVIPGVHHLDIMRLVFSFVSISYHPLASKAETLPLCHDLMSISALHLKMRSHGAGRAGMLQFGSIS
jgi:hypothetical protein